jgi:hypothetical protein
MREKKNPKFFHITPILPSPLQREGLGLGGAESAGYVG